MKQKIEQIPGGRSLLKAILQALLVLALAVGVGQGLVLPLIQGSLLEPVQRWEVEYLNGGTIELLAAELNAVAEDERQRRLDELSPQFGFNVSLEALSEFPAGKLDTDNMVRLRNLEPVGDPSDYSIYKLLDDGKHVLAFRETKIPATHVITESQRRSMGTLAMIEAELGGAPRDEWAAIIEGHASTFGYPIALLPASGLNLAADQRSDLNDGKIVSVETEDSTTADYPAEFVYKKVGSRVLTLGPFSPPTLKRFYPAVLIYYIVLGLIVFIPLALWLAPTWRSMNQLSKATTAFGKGNFSARAGAIRGSKTNHLIDVFNQMAGKIQGLVESNKALINAVSHELRTPISRIEFNIELARKSTDIAERNKQLERIEDSVDELKTMVSEMLQYARFDREKPSFTLEPVNLGEWLNGEHRNWEQGDSDVSIQLDVSDTAGQASIERYYMSRAMSNLVRNAIRFAKSTVIIAAGAKNGSIEISVSDDGPGVDYHERTRIFEPFVRHDDSRNRESGGTGLGLAIVKQIAAWHGGEVWVEESDLGGAKFVMQWPQSGGE